MELRYLRYFLAVVAEGGVTDAASALGAAQSTVSTGLRSLERELAVGLFHRSARSVRLTPAGERLVPQARRILDDVDRLRGMAAQEGGGLRGQVRIGTFTAMEQMFDLPALLRRFQGRYPGIDVRLLASLGGSRGLGEDLVRGRLDVAFLSGPARRGTEEVPVTSAPYIAVLPPDHRLAGRSSVRLAELSEDPWVDTLEGYANRADVERALGRQEIDRRVVAEVSGLPGIPAYVAAGFGVAVVPDVIECPGCAVAPVADGVGPWTLSIATRRGGSGNPVLAALSGVLVEASPTSRTSAEAHGSKNPNHGV